MRSNGPIFPARSASPTASAARWNARTPRRMAQRVIKLPDIGEGTTEAEIVSWLVKVGDIVTEEEPLAEVMTDKATIEIPSPVGGKVVALHGKPGEKLPVGSDLVVLEVAGADAPATSAPRPTASPHPPSATPPVPPLPQAGEGQQAPTQKPLSRNAGEGGERRSREPGEGRDTAPPAPRPSGLSGHKPLASPAVRQQAWDLGVELQFVPGTGPGGRITHEDLAAYAASGGRQQAARAP